ncbi:MAG: Outer membrane low permeability porin, OprB family [Candidatus Burkholderia crenata]|nr:MAG: Outer membrane low permeability porin, OprB family [Candidatus Burkholderia crenata]
MRPVQFAPRESHAESRHDSRPDTTLRAAIKRRGAPFRRAVLTSLALLALASSAVFSAAFAAVVPANPDATPSDAPEADLNIQAQPAGQWTGVWGCSNLLGDMGGIRSWLGQYGITLQATEVSEYLDNVRGGLKTGGTYDGLTTVTFGLDTQKAFGLEGGTFNASALQIHGRNLSQYNLGTLNTASGIEAQDTTRLWELWYQQSFLNKRVDVKIGQQSIDQEFIVSPSAATFVNTMFGWPGLPSYDMPSGGPAYPLSALGVRVRGQITGSLTNNNERFNDLNTDNTGLSLANPLSSGTPQTHNGDYSFYAVADQMIWRPNPDEPRSIGVFARVMGAPGDRNLVSFSANAGIVMKAPFAGRDNDNVGLGVTYIKIGNAAHDLDLATVAQLGSPCTASAPRKLRSRRPISTRSTRGGSCRAICNTPSTPAPARIRMIPRSRCATRSSSAVRTTITF